MGRKRKASNNLLNKCLEMGGRRWGRRDNKKTIFTKTYKRQEVVEIHERSRPTEVGDVKFSINFIN